MDDKKQKGKGVSSGDREWELLREQLREQLIEAFVDNYNELAAVAITITKNETIAMDLLQELICNLLTKRNGNEVKAVQTPMAFFKSALKNLYANHVRHEALIIPTDPDMLRHRQDVLDGDIAADMILLDALRSNLAGFSPKFREAFFLHYVDGYTINELAAKLNIPQNTLSQQFKRMRTRLKAQNSALWMILMLMSPK